MNLDPANPSAGDDAHEGQEPRAPDPGRRAAGTKKGTRRRRPAQTAIESAKQSGKEAEPKRPRGSWLGVGNTDGLGTRMDTMSVVAGGVGTQKPRPFHGQDHASCSGRVLVPDQRCEALHVLVLRAGAVKTVGVPELRKTGARPIRDPCGGTATIFVVGHGSGVSGLAV